MSNVLMLFAIWAALTSAFGGLMAIVGGRDGNAAMEFIEDLASRLANRVQITWSRETRK